MFIDIQVSRRTDSAGGGPKQVDCRSTQSRAAPGLRRGAVYVLGQALCRASRRIEMAWATAARVAWVPLSGLSIMKSWVMPS